MSEKFFCRVINVIMGETLGHGGHEAIRILLVISFKELGQDYVYTQVNRRYHESVKKFEHVILYNLKIVRVKKSILTKRVKRPKRECWKLQILNCTFLNNVSLTTSIIN